ncbi:hypothetical protein LJR300_003629 [Caulobacter sp. LjRoot300]
MPTITSHDQGRPSNREVENENQRPAPEANNGDANNGGANNRSADQGKAPRPATEPRGAEDSSDSPKTRTDPGSGEA